MSFIQGTGFVGISNYLRDSLIPSITTVRITNIFDNEVTDLGGYPAATITATDLLGKLADNARNARTYRFSIKIFIDRNNQVGFGTQKAETILRTLMDELISKVDADPTLNGNCIYAYPVSGRLGYVDRASNNLRLVELVLDCKDVVTYK